MSDFSFELEKKTIKHIVMGKGVSETHAEIFADCLATADLYGVTSHGKMTLEGHLGRIERGGYNLSAMPKVMKETPAFAVIDGDNAIGPISATYCMKYAIKKCKEVGVYTVFSRNNNTLGPAFYYPMLAAKAGLIGFICSNSPAQMAPIGGKDKLFGTNPFSAVIPVADGDPIIIDMATSIVAKSKFKEYKERGLSLPNGWALDKEGKPTNDPDEGIQGTVLPMAGFKGYAISMLIDILSGVASGAEFLNRVGKFYSTDASSMNVGFYMTVIDPTQVLGDTWDKEISEFVQTIRQSNALSGQKIALPGDDRIEFKTKNTIYKE